MAKRVFISYSSVDRQEAFAVFRLLQAHECDVWLDFFDITPTAVLSQELARNIEGADVVCILLSPTSIGSKWVQAEVELAQRAGIRLLPLILRPCQIPDVLSDLIGIDLIDGLGDEATCTRLVDAVLERGREDDGVLLSAAERTQLAKRELRERADEKFSTAVETLSTIVDEPIHDLTIEVDPRRFPPDQIIELKLTLDPLWTQPMSFFLANYREGGTWPQEFDFHEPSYKQYTRARRARLDCKFRWYERVLEPAPGLDSTDFEFCPATFTFEFDGQQFQPRGSGPHLPQTFEIPSLRHLWDNNSHFELITHDPQAKSARVIDLSTTDVDISVSTRQCRLFRSRHSAAELNLLRAKSLAAIDNPIQREAYLGILHEPKRRRERAQGILRTLHEGGAVADEDRRFAARLCFGGALLASHRGQHLDALKGYEKCARMLEPVVLEGYPTYEEGMLMYRACDNLLGYYLQHEKFARAADFVNGVGLVAQRLLDLHPDEPEYHRLWGDALLENAIVHAENGDLDRGAAELAASVEPWIRLYRDLPSRERFADARRAVARGMRLAKKWDIEQRVPVADWQREFDADGALSTDLRESAKRREDGPVWLEPCDLERWPTITYESPLLRYRLQIPKRYGSSPELTSTARETAHVFRGPWPTEWLIVSFMDKAQPGADMKQWVEAITAMVGFPVLEMTSSDGPLPQLLEWRQEAGLEHFAKRVAADEAHAYMGLATLPGKEAHRARLYILLVRRGTLAWKITLVFESACVPGMPPAMVNSNDHVRAGAVLGRLELG